MRSITLLLALVASGCRDDAPAPADPAPAPAGIAAPTPARGDSVTVLFFGDSLTEGYGLPGVKSEAYPALVAGLASADGVPLRAVNAGISGNTSADGRARLAWILDRTTPDVFVLALGANDGLRGLSPERMRENLAAILAEVRARHPDAQLVVAGIEAPPNYGSDYVDRFRQVFPSVAEEYDAALIPFLLDGVAGVLALNLNDRIHPSAAGHVIIARLMWDALEPLVRASAPA